MKTKYIHENDINNSSYIKFIISYKYYPFLNKEQTLKDIESLNFFNLKNNDFFIKDTNNKEIFPSHLWLNLVLHTLRTFKNIKLDNNNDFLSLIENFYNNIKDHLTHFRNDDSFEQNTFNNEQINDLSYEINNFLNIFNRNVNRIEESIKNALSFYSKLISLNKLYLCLKNMKQDAFISYYTNTTKLPFLNPNVDPLRNDRQDPFKVYDKFIFDKQRINENTIKSLASFEVIKKDILYKWDVIKNNLNSLNIDVLKQCAINGDVTGYSQTRIQSSLNDLMKTDFDHRKEVQLKDAEFNQKLKNLTNNIFYELMDFSLLYQVLNNLISNTFDAYTNTLMSTKRMYKFRQTIVLKTFHNFKETGLDCLEKNDYDGFEEIINDIANDWDLFHNAKNDVSIPKLVFVNRRFMRMLQNNLQCNVKDYEQIKDLCSSKNNRTYLIQKDLIDKTNRNKDISLEDKLNVLPLYDIVLDITKQQDYKQSPFYYENINIIDGLKNYDPWIDILNKITKQLDNNPNTKNYLINDDLIRKGLIFSRYDFRISRTKVWDKRPSELNLYSVSNENKNVIRTEFLNWCNYIESKLNGWFILEAFVRTEFNVTYLFDKQTFARLDNLLYDTLNHNEEIILPKFTYKANNGYEDEINKSTIQNKKETKIRR